MADVINYRFRLRRGLVATWTALDDVLLDGEMGLETDTGEIKIGDGATGWNDLDYLDKGFQLGRLKDVDATGRSDGQVLKWNAAVGKHVYATPTGGGGGDDRSPVSNAVSSSGTLAVDYSGGDFHIASLNENITAWSFSNMPGTGHGAHLEIEIAKGSTDYTLAWPSNFLWPDGAAAISAGTFTRDLLTLKTLNNGTTWVASLKKDVISKADVIAFMQGTMAVVYDASDLSTLFQDAAGTVPVTTDGDPVGRWNDQTGSGKDWIQPTNGVRPIYRTDGVRHWLQFDGTKAMIGASNSMLAFATLGVFAAYRFESGAPSDYAVLAQQPHTTTHTNPYHRWAILLRTTSSNEIALDYNGSIADVDADAAAIGNDVAIAAGFGSMLNATNTQQNAVAYANGTQVSSGTAVTAITYPNNVPPELGASGTNTVSFFKGRVYGLAVYNGTIALARTVSLGNRWGQGLIAG